MEAEEIEKLRRIATESGSQTAREVAAKKLTEAGIPVKEERPKLVIPNDENEEKPVLKSGKAANKKGKKGGKK